MQKIETDLYKRELVKEVKNAYYKYLQACEAVNIYQTALSLVKENLRVNTALFNNQKINRTTVVRSDNEVIKYNALLESARQVQNNARAYFNFLLNADLNTEIIGDSIVTHPAGLFLTDTTVVNREELAKLKEAVAINQNAMALAKSYKRPRLNSFVDLGTQAFDFKVNSKSFYYLAGISLEWNIFSGNKNKYKIQQVASDGQVLQSQTNYIEQQLRFQLIASINSFKSSVAAYNAAQYQVISSQKYYNDMFRLYKEGQVLFITKKIANESEVVAPGSPVLAINETSGNNNWTLKLGVTDKEWAAINIGKIASVSIDAFPDKIFTATVFRKSQAADPNSGSFQVELRLDLSGSCPAIGMFAKAAISTNAQKTLSAIPYDALIEADGNAAFVFIPDGATKVRRIPVTIESFDNGQVYIKAGLENINEVIVSNSAFLNEKSRINIIK